MTRGPNRVLAFLVIAVVLVAASAGVVVANRSTPTLDPDTPEATVQQYLQAVLDGDFPAAADLLAGSSDCDTSDVAQAYLPESARIVLDRTTVDGDRAVVTLDVADGGGGPFGDSGYSRTERVSLALEDDAWKITGSSWLLYTCDSTEG